MYNLLVSNALADLGDDPLSISRNRFLEYTTDAISSQLRSLSTEAINCIMSWPCLVMEEGRGEEEAYIAQIESIGMVGAELVLRMSWFDGMPILNDDLWRIRDRLDIEQFEFSRHHWAIKDRDLIQTLLEAGVRIDSQCASNFENHPLPAPPRSRLIEARNVMSDWSHTRIDDFVLEAGVEGLVAGRDIGSRRDRANAIIQFAIDDPSAKTAEDSLLSAFIMRGAYPPTDHSITDDVRGTTRTIGNLRTEGNQIDRVGHRRSPNRVFVVHGRNEVARDQIVEFLASIGLEGIVLHEQPNMGRHLLTKFIEEAELVTFAVVIMTADDVGGRTQTDLAPRARQNVILELGYFLSHLGQPRVCALISPGLETPSDFDGIVYISMSGNGQWKTELKRELGAAGMPLSEVGTGNAVPD